MALGGRQLLDAAHDMAVIRRFEERVERLYFDSKIRGSVHLGIGQEAVAVGACRALVDGDTVAATYRGHAWVLARGVPADAAFAEMLGKETGCNRGRGGSKHLGDPARGVLPSNAIVGATAALGCGTAWAAQYAGSGAVTVSVFGDGATNQGVVHEAMNLAAVMRLPVVFLCENNGYSEMTPIGQATTVERLAERAAAYRMDARTADGMDVVAVHDAVADAADRARDGAGPVFLEVITYRFCGHMPGDPGIYRTREEVDDWRQRDPLDLVREPLALAGFDRAAVDEAYARATAVIDAADRFALDSPLPAADQIGVGAPPWASTARPARHEEVAR